MYLYRPQRSCGQGYRFYCDDKEKVNQGGGFPAGKTPLAGRPPAVSSPWVSEAPLPLVGRPPSIVNPSGGETPLTRRTPQQGEPPQNGVSPWQWRIPGIRSMRWPVRIQLECILFFLNVKGSFTPGDYVAVTVTLTRGTFDLFIKMKRTARQRNCHRYVIAWCE